MTLFISSLKKGEARAAAVLVTFLYAGEGPGQVKLAHWLLANKPSFFPFSYFLSLQKLLFYRDKSWRRAEKVKGE